MDIQKEATQVLKDLYGNNAKFREGQYEAIEATLTKMRTLVVQKTGWGKSLVYFTATKLLRNSGHGVTFVVSPLLVLMDNQVEAAQKLNLKCDCLNSTTKDRRSEILNNLVNNQLDMVFITPETLFSDDIQRKLKDIAIGLFVIDEAHCISDWGHDFRLEYCNLYKVIQQMPSNVPILATTATANNRVVKDLVEQLGSDVYVSRGPLTRESLAIQVVRLTDRASRYAWLKKNINRLPGSGIVYCLTNKDCYYVTDFLVQCGISAMQYSGKNEDEANLTAIEKFRNNEIKVIVATTKLGMGYDKSDIGFVVHFQMPSNIVSYYQQIGRAGRNLELAYAILMAGKEDEDIIDYFINEAFPTREECESACMALENSNGLSLYAIVSKLNFPTTRIKKALMFLENEGAIYKENGKYYRSLNKYEYNEEHYNEITAIRKQEKEQMQQLLTVKTCYSRFVVNCLDDDESKDCGKCANCLRRDLMDFNITQCDIDEALAYIKGIVMQILPRQMWAHTSLTEAKRLEFVNQEGICLCKYGDVGYGELVKRDKYQGKEFCDELLEKSAAVLAPFVEKNSIKHITFVPSLRSNLVKNFTVKLAKKLKLTLLDCLVKSSAQQQKYMQNSSYQCYNALNSFSVRRDSVFPEKVLLVDDMVDSKWTITVCGHKLMENGVKEVYPFALADSSKEGQ